MRNIWKITAVIPLMLVMMVCAAGAGDKNAAEILAKCDAAEGYEAVYGQYDQIITTSSGDKRTLKIRAWAVTNGDRQLSEYLAPADIKGQRILMTEDGDNIWMFNAETRRTRKLGSHMKKKKVMGSDFTYEDQAGGKISEKYTGVLIGVETEGGVECHVLDLTPTPKGPSYSKVRVWIAKADHVTRRVDYYQDNQDEPFKRLINSDIREVEYQKDGKTVIKIVPFKMVMTNLDDRTETENITLEIRFGVDIPDSIFNPRKLDS
jgi:outer membrane lipoprotein-sorting protein